MSGASEALKRYRQAEAAVREEVGRLLAPAGLAVRGLRPEGGGGWRLWVIPAGAPAPRAGAGEGAVGMEPPAEAGGAGSPTAGAAPLARRDGETLAELVSRADGRLRVGRGEGPGGIRAVPATAEARVEWLAGTLVGDTLLALRHAGEPEDAEAALRHLYRQLGRFRGESERLGGSGDPAPFLAALGRWAPAGFPGGAEFLDGAEAAAHA